MTLACASANAILPPRASAWRRSRSGTLAINSVLITTGPSKYTLSSVRPTRQDAGHHTMLKPPLMLITWPVIQPECFDASSATIGAMSAAWPRRRTG